MPGDDEISYTTWSELAALGYEENRSKTRLTQPPLSADTARLPSLRATLADEEIGHG